MKFLLKSVFLALIFFSLFFLAPKLINAQDCTCGGCNVGFICDYCNKSGESGPATWHCVGGCCNRPDSCAGYGACHPNGYHVDSRPGCASSAASCKKECGDTYPDCDGSCPGSKICVVSGSACKCQSTSTPTPPTETPLPIQPQRGPIPSPYVPCDETRPTEFHSLRPYQASPCNQELEDIALFCGNDLIIYDEITILKRFLEMPTGDITYPQIVGLYYHEDTGIFLPDCTENGDGYETCWFAIPRQKDFLIDLTDAYLPIMGNTELVVNSQQQPAEVMPDYLDDPAKVNEYISWYLNGIIGRAEYPPLNVSKNCISDSGYAGYCTSFGSWEWLACGLSPYLFKDGQGSCQRGHECCVHVDDKEVVDTLGRDKLINFSGPLKKLLSWESQIVRRIAESRRAGIDRHDQIIGCVDGSDPVECYPGDAKRIRLSYWNDTDNNYPPLQRDFATFDEFWRAYNIWRNNNLGRLFQYVPFSSTEDRMGEVEADTFPTQYISPDMYLTEVILLNQEPAELFFAHMQESFELSDLLQQTIVYKEGPKDELARTYSTSQDCRVTEIRNNPGDDLFAGEISATASFTANFSCILPLPGDGRLCELLGATCQVVPDNYDCEVYYDSATNNGAVDCYNDIGTAIEGGSVCANNCTPIPQTATCNNMGKQCYPSDWHSCVGVTDSEVFVCPYPWICNNTPCLWGGTCDKVSCEEYGIVRICPAKYCPDGQDCYKSACTGDLKCADSCERPVTYAFPIDVECTVNPYVTVETITKTPLAKEIWSKLVAGPAGVFRKFPPKIEPDAGAPIEYLDEIPAASPVKYISLDGSTVVAGSPVVGRPGAEAEIYFPFIGGLHQYFLQCTQTILRPLGFAEECPKGSPPPENPLIIAGLECPYDTVPAMSTNPSCKLSWGNIRGINIPPLMKKLFEAAGARYNVPPDLIAGVMYSEGGFEPRVANPSCYGEYTEANIEYAILCEFPNCAPERYNPPCNYSIDGAGCDSAGPYQELRCPWSDPNEHNRCNFYDATMAQAAKLARDRYGIPDYSGSGDGSTSCLGYSYNTGSIQGSISCTESAWPCRDVITALRFETGYCHPSHFRDALLIYGHCL